MLVINFILLKLVMCIVMKKELCIIRINRKILYEWIGLNYLLIVRIKVLLNSFG